MVSVDLKELKMLECQIKRVNFQSYLLMTFIHQLRVKCNFRKNLMLL